MSKTKAVDTAESSPYFGLNACAWWARRYGHDKVLALDVGGTTAKLGVIADGKPMTVEHGDLLGVPLQTPWTLLRSEAVGGGSVAHGATADQLGPESQGAYPGPACYDLGGKQATLTDAFVAAGMLNPERFLGGRRALRVDLAQRGARRRSSPRARDRHGAPTWSPSVARDTLELRRRAAASSSTASAATAATSPRAWPTSSASSARYVFALGPVLSAFGSSVAEICHVYEEWGDGHRRDRRPRHASRSRATSPARRTCASRSRSPTT